MSGKVVRGLRVIRTDLREPVSPELPRMVKGRKVRGVSRRAKYILVGFAHGSMLVHLGMSGTVHADRKDSKRRKHDHVEWFVGDCVMRYNDPRRFGRILWCDDAGSHPLLAAAGVEPLETAFSGRRLGELSAGKRQPVKQLLMDGRKVAGVGNIYASEALHLAGVMPDRPAGDLGEKELAAIARHVKGVLRRAIKAGGSTLRDHGRVDGKPGYFQLQHRVYGRDGQPCRNCGTAVQRTVLGQRSTFFCPTCQR